MLKVTLHIVRWQTKKEQIANDCPPELGARLGLGIQQWLFLVDRGAECRSLVGGSMYYTTIRQYAPPKPPLARPRYFQKAQQQYMTETIPPLSENERIVWILL